jgi:hypothetical protein
VSGFGRQVIDAAAREREVRLTTKGRKSGDLVSVTIWISTDGRRIFIRSGAGLGRHWTQNFQASGRATLQLGDLAVEVQPRHVTDPSEARAISQVVRQKYGSFVKPSRPGEPLTSGEQATFELLPAD